MRSGDIYCELLYLLNNLKLKMEDCKKNEQVVKDIEDRIEKILLWVEFYEKLFEIKTGRRRIPGRNP